MSDSQIQILASDVTTLLNSAKLLETEKDGYGNSGVYASNIASLQQTIVDTNNSILRRQRSELDTKTRIMGYAEDDMKRNFKLLNSQYIILVGLICIVVFVLLWSFFELIMDSPTGKSAMQSVQQQFRGGFKSFFSMTK